MIESLNELLSNSAIGSIIGLLGGYLNRRLDSKNQQDTYQAQLAKLDRVYEVLQEVIQKTSAPANTSFKFASSVDEPRIYRAAKLLRPLLTLGMFLLVVYAFQQVLGYVDTFPLIDKDVTKAYFMCLEWILFQAGISIGWWYANRPSSNMKG